MAFSESSVLRNGPVSSATDCPNLLSRGLMQVVSTSCNKSANDRMQQACKIDNLQQVCSVFVCANVISFNVFLKVLMNWTKFLRCC